MKVSDIQNLKVKIKN